MHWLLPIRYGWCMVYGIYNNAKKPAGFFFLPLYPSKKRMNTILKLFFRIYISTKCTLSIGRRHMPFLARIQDVQNNNVIGIIIHMILFKHFGASVWFRSF